MAYELTELVHGKEEADKAQEAAKALFGGGGDSANMPSYELSEEDFEDGKIGLLALLQKCGLAPSRSEARRNVEQGGVSVDGVQIKDIKAELSKDQIGSDGIVVKRGKKNFMKITIK